MIRVLCLSLYGAKAASHRVRFSQYKAGLASKDIEMEIHSLLDDSYITRRFSGKSPSIQRLTYAYVERLCVLAKAKRFDLAIVYAELFPLMPGFIERALLQVPYILDFDDAFYLKYKKGGKAFLGSLLGNKFDYLLRNAVAVTAGSSELMNYALEFNRQTTLLPSVVDTDRLKPKVGRLDPEKFTVGWIGSPSTAPYLEMLVDPLQRFSKLHPLRLIVVGGSSPSIPGVEIIECDWSLEKEVEMINQFTVGVMPLPDNSWTRGKCAYKLIQYMSCGIPCIASPVGANLDVVRASNGILASSSDDWLQALRRLHNDPSLRSELGRVARRRVMRQYSLESALPVMEDVIRSCTAHRYQREKY